MLNRDIALRAISMAAFNAVHRNKISLLIVVPVAAAVAGVVIGLGFVADMVVKMIKRRRTREL